MRRRPLPLEPSTFDHQVIDMAITLTESAARHIRNQIAKRGKGVGLRLGVKRVGCSGLAYTMDFADAAARDGHAVI